MTYKSNKSLLIIYSIDFFFLIWIALLICTTYPLSFVLNFLWNSTRADFHYIKPYFFFCFSNVFILDHHKFLLIFVIVVSRTWSGHLNLVTDYLSYHLGI